MSGSDAARSVSANYTPGDLAVKILAGLQAAGKDPDALTIEDLAPVDQFHMGGRGTTDELLARAGLTAEMRVLDVGGGLGGSARTLAASVGCHVTVLDLSEEYCRVGEMLTARVGLSDRVRFEYGDALAMPFADGSFDAVWTQHSSMNVADKGRLYAEIYRVLPPGGRLAIHEVMAGPIQPILYPVPWAYDASISHLQPPAEIRSLLRDTGFIEREWVDVTSAATAWFQALAARTPASAGPPPLGFHLVVDNFAERGRSQLRNLEEGRVVAIQALLVRPGG